MRFATLLSFLLLFGCGPETTPGVGPLLQPRAGSSLPYPVYEDFSELEPLFKQNNDTTYIINFWATWCKPCVEELPLFQQLALAYAEAPIRTVLVSLDEEEDVATKLPRFLAERNIDLPVVVLTDPQAVAWRAKLDPDWNGTIPTTIIYKKGLRFFAEEQFSTYFDLEEKVSPLLP